MDYTAAGYDVFRVRWLEAEERRPTQQCDHCMAGGRKGACGGRWVRAVDLPVTWRRFYWYDRLKSVPRWYRLKDDGWAGNDDEKCYVQRSEEALTAARMKVERQLMADGYRLVRLEYVTVGPPGAEMIGQPTAVWVRPRTD